MSKTNIVAVYSMNINEQYQLAAVGEVVKSEEMVLVLNWFSFSWPAFLCGICEIRF